MGIWHLDCLTQINIRMKLLTMQSRTIMIGVCPILITTLIPNLFLRKDTHGALN